SGRTRRNDKGETGSLKVRVRRAGGAAITTPAAGSLAISEACANAAPVPASTVTKAMMIAAKRMALLRGRKQLQLRSRLRIVRTRLSGGRDFDPAVHPLLALLHDRK